MWKAVALSICAAFLLRATSHAAELTESTAYGPLQPRRQTRSALNLLANIVTYR